MDAAMHRFSLSVTRCCTALSSSSPVASLVLASSIALAFSSSPLHV